MYKTPAHFMPGPPPVIGVDCFMTCPFCNREYGQPMQFVPNDDSGLKEYHYIQCIQCNAIGPKKPTYEAALAAWNNRSISYEVL